MKKYINMFLDNAPKLLDNIDKALAIKDYPTIKIAAHSLKPQLSYMGVKEEVSKIFMIEQSAGEAAHFGTLPILIRNLNLLCNKAFIELKNN
jgi:HPt (histidine-containing phosphotransfer) domain-containing protein